MIAMLEPLWALSLAVKLNLCGSMGAFWGFWGLSSKPQYSFMVRSLCFILSLDRMYSFWFLVYGGVFSEWLDASLSICLAFFSIWLLYFHHERDTVVQSGT